MHFYINYVIDFDRKGETTMKKTHIVSLIVIFLFVVIFSFYIIGKSKKPLLAPEKGFETIGNGEKYDLPARSSVPNLSDYDELKKIGVPKGYQIVENEHGVFLLVYIEDTFRYSYIANYKKINDKTHIQLVFEYLSIDSQFDMKLNHREVLGIYKLKEKSTHPIVVEYYEFETKTWEHLNEVNLLSRWK